MGRERRRVMVREGEDGVKERGELRRRRKREEKWEEKRVGSCDEGG